MAIPTFYYAFLERPEFREAARGWGNVRLFTCGSAPIRPEVLPGLESVLGRPVINRYGMTEAHVIASLPLDGPWPPGSVGLPLKGVEFRVTRDDGMRRGGRRAGDRLAARAEPVSRVLAKARGHPAPHSAAAGSTPATWAPSTTQGFLTLVGRKNDLIITNGFNVYPQVVERVINACPGVRESAVLGVADPRRGERVVAVVVRDDPTLDERGVRAFCAERLVDYQRPHDIRLRRRAAA